MWRWPWGALMSVDGSDEGRECYASGVYVHSMIISDSPRWPVWPIVSWYGPLEPRRTQWVKFQLSDVTNTLQTWHSWGLQPFGLELPDFNGRPGTTVKWNCMELLRLYFHRTLIIKKSFLDEYDPWCKRFSFVNKATLNSSSLQIDEYHCLISNDSMSPYDIQPYIGPMCNDECPGDASADCSRLPPGGANTSEICWLISPLIHSYIRWL